MSSTPAPQQPRVAELTGADQAFVLAGLLFECIPPALSPEADAVHEALDRWLFSLARSDA